jgi:PAS domain S-box-containing protein
VISPPSRPPHPRDVLIVTSIGLAYYLAHRISFFFPDSAKVLMAVWPAGGIGLASLLLCQRRLWPAILAVMFVAGNTANLLSGRPVVCSLGFMTANVLESFGCAWVVIKWSGSSPTFTRVKDVVALIFAATAVNACTSFVGAGTAFFTHTASFRSFWVTWWVADGLGILIVTPLIVLWSNLKGLIAGFRWSKVPEPAAFTAFWALAAWASFYPQFIHRAIAPQPYMVLAFLAWVALRLGQRWMTITLVILSIFVLTSKSVIAGPLAWGGYTPQTRMLLSQIYLGFAAGTGFLLAASYAEAKAATAALRESEKKYRNLFNNAEVGMFRTRADGSEVIDFNEKYLEIFGRTREEMQGSPTVIHWADPAQREEILRKLETAKFVLNYPCEMLHKSGLVRDCLVSVRLYKNEGFLEGSITDITDLHQAQQQVVDSLAFNKAVVESSPIGIIVYKASGECISANRAACEISGGAPEQLLAQNFWNMETWQRDGITELAETALTSGKPVKREVHSTSSFGRTLWFNMSFVPFLIGKEKHLFLLIEDISARRQAEEDRRTIERQLHQTQKLESLGVLAGGIAHDFNNLLTGIFGYLDLAREDSEPGSTVRRTIEKALKPFARAKDLTQQLLTFSKGGAPVKKTGLLGPVVREDAQFALSGSSVSCSFDIAEDLWPCDFDENQIGQVVHNIVLNAVQAMPTGGSMTVTAANSELGPGEIPQLKEGRYVKLCFSDTGIGIPQSILQHIFDPFFTTKQKGNGLGLATVFSIVTKHGGTVTAESIQGKGSSFTIHLPASFGAVAAPAAPPAADRTGSGRILVMDDEDFILDVATAMLTSLGYSADTAAHGRETIDKFNKAAGTGAPFDLVIVDLTIPGGMGGKQTKDELRKIAPLTKIIASSGYSDDPIMSHPLENGFDGSVKKPYNKTELAETVEMVMKRS